MNLPNNPLIYEINTAAWLEMQSQRRGEKITLGTVSDAVLDEIAALHFDMVWLMGVWKRSPAAQLIARTHPGLQHEYSLALPDFTVNDVVGSPYAIHQYTVDNAFGGRDALAVLRGKLAERGIKLMLDYVPNHVATDHHWTIDAPEALVRGTTDDLTHRPSYYYQSENEYIFAHGRDPYFPAWTDTAQVDAFSAVARDRAIELLLDVAAQCDGVRCDMAMLMVSRIFSQTWNRQDAPPIEFWQHVISAVRSQYPDFVFMAEVYWDMEGELLALGFDYAYDKRLYDRMRDKGADQIRDHLLAGLEYQKRMTRFIENHDEKRAADVFRWRNRAAATLVTLLPGATLIHEGQLEGWRRKLPVQLGRRYAEPNDETLHTFYRRLLTEAALPIYHQGVFMTLGANPILGNDDGHDELVSFAWVLGEEWRIIAVNYSERTVRARILLPIPAWANHKIGTFRDVLSDLVIQEHPLDVLTRGLELSLNPFEARVFQVMLT
jgi:hypothetical protein